MRMGMTEGEALSIIMVAANNAIRNSYTKGELDPTWLSDVYEVARCQLQDKQPN